MAQPQRESGRQSRGEATRLDIVCVAKRLFSQQGYHSTGISDIQSATGLTKGAFYHHFASKEDVALAVLEAARNEYAEFLIGPAMHHASATDRVLALMELGVSLNLKPEWNNCQLLTTLCTEMTSSDVQLRETILEMHKHKFSFWRDQLAGCADEGTLRDGIKPEIGAQLIMSATTGALTARKLGNEAFDLSDVLDSVKQALFNKDALKEWDEKKAVKNEIA